MAQLPTAVQRVLEGLTTGNWDGIEQHLTPDVFHDASVPGWRMQRQGVTDVAKEMRSWPVFRELQHLQAHLAGDTVIVELQGVHDSPHGPLTDRFANFFELRDGRIAEHRYYCCGEWDEATVGQLELLR